MDANQNPTIPSYLENKTRLTSTDESDERIMTSQNRYMDVIDKKTRDNYRLTSVDLISDDLNSKSEKSENLDEGSKEDSENSQIEKTTTEDEITTQPQTPTKKNVSETSVSTNAESTDTSINKRETSTSQAINGLLKGANEETVNEILMMKFSEMQKDVLFLQKSLVDMHKSLLNEENNNKLLNLRFNS